MQKTSFQHIICSLIFLLLIPGSTLFSIDENEQLFLNGNQNYQQENYDEAIASYERILNNGFESWELYFNLGNAYFRSGHVGMAILNYERARRLAPLNADIRHNLEIANLSIADKIEVPPKFFLIEIGNAVVESLGLKLNLNELTKYVLLVYLILMFLVIARILIVRPEIRRILFYFIIPIFILLILIVITLQVEIYSDKKNVEAILIASEVDVYGAPEENSTLLFSLHEGVKIRIQNNLDKDNSKWLEIQLSDGKAGWVRDTGFERI
ncbi:tetratricopeptide repeat protein [candidate division KSB1 bacterium]|nr:tetratricopeptide repeat protein [candidate division KSB1 bacterium]